MNIMYEVSKKLKISKIFQSEEAAWSSKLGGFTRVGSMYFWHISQNGLCLGQIEVGQKKVASPKYVGPMLR